VNARLTRLLSLAGCLLLAAPAGAQYTLPKWSADNGGGRSTGARFEVHGTIGQPDAATLLLGSRFALAGGFWADVQDARIFRDGFEGG
jgi:hypothetical protein